jgi:hypothetical protein
MFDRIKPANTRARRKLFKQTVSQFRRIEEVFECSVDNYSRLWAARELQLGISTQEICNDHFEIQRERCLQQPNESAEIGEELRFSKQNIETNTSRQDKQWILPLVKAFKPDCTRWVKNNRNASQADRLCQTGTELPTPQWNQLCKWKLKWKVSQEDCTIATA